MFSFNILDHDDNSNKIKELELFIQRLKPHVDKYYSEKLNSNSNNMECSQKLISNSNNYFIDVSKCKNILGVHIDKIIIDEEPLIYQKVNRKLKLITKKEYLKYNE